MLSLAIKERMEISLLGEPRLVGGVSSVLEGIDRTKDILQSI